MAIRGILLSLNTYPDPTPVVAVDHAAALARRLGARLDALIFELKLDRTGPVNFLADALLDLPRLIREATRKSGAQAAELALAFKTATANDKPAGTCAIERCLPVAMPDVLAERGRFHDLVVVPVLADDEVGAMHAEAAIFGCGRPVLLLPVAALSGAPAFDRVVVACDYGRAMARAIGDALPLLRAASQVELLSVVNEKALPEARLAYDLSRHLAAHGVTFTAVNVDAAGRPVGEVIAAEARSRGADLLVMGAYGHSRLKEFVLGGATRSILAAPPLPVLLSH